MLAKEDQLKTVTLLHDNNEWKYNKFNLRASDETVFHYLEELGMDGIVRDGYVILNKYSLHAENLKLVIEDHSYLVAKSECKFISCDLLEKHHIAIGYIENKPTHIFANTQNIAYLNLFKNKIIDLQIKWSREFLNEAYVHLKNRRSENQMLINKEIIQTMLADVMIHIKSAAVHRQHTNTLTLASIEEDQSLAIMEIKKANHLLAKLYGGRSFLTGNVVEMIMVFEYFRNIYFD